MRISRSITPALQARVVVLTADAAFEESVRATFSASPQIGLDVVKGRLAERDGQIDVAGATVVVADVDAADEAELQALERLMLRIGSWPPVVAITQSFDGAVARRLMQMRLADFLVKPVSSRKNAPTSVTIPPQIRPVAIRPSMTRDTPKAINSTGQYCQISWKRKIPRLSRSSRQPTATTIAPKKIPWLPERYWRRDMRSSHRARRAACLSSQRCRRSSQRS